jgi:ElaB/YqjD/DUF883 family membrane-anchored ribosome-binding protein
MNTPEHAAPHAAQSAAQEATQRRSVGSPAQQREARRRAAVARLVVSRLHLQKPSGAARPWAQQWTALSPVLAGLVQGHPWASAAAAAAVGALFAQLRPWRWLSGLGTLVGPAVLAVCTRQIAVWLAALQPAEAGPAAGADQASTRASKNA